MHKIAYIEKSIITSDVVSAMPVFTSHFFCASVSQILVNRHPIHLLTQAIGSKASSPTRPEDVREKKKETLTLFFLLGYEVPRDYIHAQNNNTTPSPPAEK